MKKYLVFFTFCYFTLFSFGHAADWAPDSLEGFFLKVTIDVPEHQMTIMGSSITVPYSTQTVYSYIHKGTMYWGYDEKQMLKPMFFDYQKKSDQSFDLETWIPNTKTQYIKGSITMMDETSGYGPVVTVINLSGHPLNGEEVFPGTVSYEVLSSSPLLPPEITTGIYSIEGNTSANWVVEEGTSDNGLYEYTNYHFKHFLPTEKNWSVEWVDKAFAPNGLTSWRPTSLTLNSDQAGADVNFYLYDHNANFNFYYFPVSSMDLASTEDYTVSTSSYNSSIDSGIRLHYLKTERKLTAEFDENLTGNWVLFFEGSMDAGVDSWTYHNPSSGVQTKFVDTQFEALPGYFIDVEDVVNQDIEATNSFTISGPRPVSLTIAVGEDSLDDISSASQADFATAGSDIGGGWRSLDWFGYYYATTAGWLYHINHGWIYPVVTSFDSVWFYSPMHEWLWTTQSAYPWTWFNTGQCWKYYLKKTGDWLTFNQDSGSFEQTENATELEEESNDVPSVVNATMEIYSDLFDYTEIVDLQTMFPYNSVRNFSISDMGYDSNKMKAQAQMQFFTTWADVEIEFTRPEGTAVLSTLTDNDSDEVPDFFDWPQSYYVSVVGDVNAQWNAFTYNDPFWGSEIIPAGTVTYGLGNSNLVRASDSQELVITRSISRTATTLGYFYAEELPNGRIDTFTPKPVKASGTVELYLSAGNYSSEVTVSGDGVKTSTSLQGNGTASIQGDQLSLSDLPLPSMGNADLGKIHPFLADESMMESVTLTKRGEVYSGYVSKNQVHYWVEVSGL